jgi:hypothetical protein
MAGAAIDLFRQVEEDIAPAPTTAGQDTTTADRCIDRLPDTGPAHAQAVGIPTAAQSGGAQVAPAAVAGPTVPDKQL